MIMSMSDQQLRREARLFAAAHFAGVSRLIRLMAILASFALSRSLWAGAPPIEVRSDKAIEEIADALVPELMRERKIPGAAVAVVSGDTVVLAKGYGVADLENQTPVTSETVFQL